MEKARRWRGGKGYDEEDKKSGRRNIRGRRYMRMRGRRQMGM